MKKLKYLFGTFLLCATIALGQAPTALSSTTLNGSITARQGTLVVTSATGMAAMVNAGPAQGGIGDPSTLASYVLYIDTEAIIIRGISGTTITVAQRGAQGTKSEAHNTGARIWFGPSTAFTTFDQEGSCTYLLYSANAYLPRINMSNGKVFNCPLIGSGTTATGQWVWAAIGSQSLAPVTRFSFGCTGTVGSGETEYMNGSACSGATTAAVGQQIVANTGTIYGLQVAGSAVAVGGSNKDVITIIKNGTGTSLTCTIPGTSVSKVCSDTLHGVSVVSGDLITVSLVTASMDTLANVAITFEER